jgi:hypothetical protein
VIQIIRIAGNTRIDFDFILNVFVELQTSMKKPCVD